MDLRLIQIENEIINFYCKLNNKFGRDKNQATIYAYALIYQRITQDFIKQKTSFSMGLISASFNALLEKKILRVDPFNKTRKNSYILSIPEFSLVIKDRGENGLNKNQISIYFKNFIFKQMKTLPKYEKSHMEKRLFDLIFSLKFNQVLIRKNSRSFDFSY